MWTISLFIFHTLLFQTNNAACDQCFPIAGKYAASHILVSFDGAERATVNAKRSKKEAKAKAVELVAQLKMNPELFEKLAAAESDGPSSIKNGYVGGFRPEQMASAFVKAVRKLKVGEISGDPVRTQFGYHIIRRESMRPKHYSATMLLVSYKGALSLKGMSEEIERSQEEARVQIEKLAKEITPENFMEHLQENSDFIDRSDSKNVFLAGESEIYLPMSKALDQVGFEQVTDVVDLSVGYALLKRHRVERRAGSRILICYTGSKFAPVQVNRSRSEARQLAEDLLARLQTGKESFEEMAKLYSNEPFGLRGGTLPEWFAGSGEKTLDRTFDSLAIGEISPNIIETIRGFHIVLRREPKK